MARSLGKELRMLIAAVVMAAFGLLFVTPAQAHGQSHSASHHRASGGTLMTVSPSIVTVASATPACAHSGQGTIPPSCCQGNACLTMHNGVIPVPSLSAPSRVAFLQRRPSGPLDEGIAPPPARKPPRATV